MTTFATISSNRMVYHEPLALKNVSGINPRDFKELRRSARDLMPQ